jgi:hypothetical protein
VKLHRGLGVLGDRLGALRFDVTVYLRGIQARCLTRRMEAHPLSVWPPDDGSRESSTGPAVQSIHSGFFPLRRVIPGAPGYFADSAGVIWSSKSGTLVPLRPAKVPDGYHLVTLYVHGRKITRSVHSLVLSAFIGPRPNGLVACHNNGTRHDNRLENLRWDSQSANLRDRVAHGTSYRGEGNPRAKLTTAQVLRDQATATGR